MKAISILSHISKIILYFILKKRGAQIKTTVIPVVSISFQIPISPTRILEYRSLKKTFQGKGMLQPRPALAPR